MPGDPGDDPEGGLPDTAHAGPARANGAARSTPGPDGGSAGRLAIHSASSSSSTCHPDVGSYDGLPQALASTGKFPFPGADSLASSIFNFISF